MVSMERCRKESSMGVSQIPKECAREVWSLESRLVSVSWKGW